MRMSDWSSDVCSSDLQFKLPGFDAQALVAYQKRNLEAVASANKIALEGAQAVIRRQSEIVRKSVEDASKALSELRSEEHTSELQSLMRISYAVFCLKKKTNNLKKI